MKHNHHKITMLASGSPGQTRLVERFVENEYKDEWAPVSIEDSYTVHFTVDGELCQIDILDTATTQQFFGLRYHWIRNGQVFIITYSNRNPWTFSCAKVLCKLVNEVKLEDQYLAGVFDDDKYPAVILCGNQMDRPTAERQVCTQEAKEFADELGITFIETSARTGQNITKLFEDAVRLDNKMRNHLKEVYEKQNENIV